MPIGIPQTSTGVGRFGVHPPNAISPRGSNPASPQDAGVEVPWYQSGPVWVILFLVAGYILVFQTLK
jgi:hypothetical protein